jgi:hypothetical protein
MSAAAGRSHAEQDSVPATLSAGAFIPNQSLSVVESLLFSFERISDNKLISGDNIAPSLGLKQGCPQENIPEEN